jgi:uncharacterized protein YndB with AHSA1/START domain
LAGEVFLIQKIREIRKVEVFMEIFTEPERIIQAFTDPDMLRGWWEVERALIEKRIGGLYTLAWNITDRGFGFISSGIIKNYQPGSILEIGDFIYLNPGISILGPMSLIVRVKKKRDGAELYLCQDGYQNGPDWDWYYEAVKQAWPAVAKTLKEYLEKK